MNSILFKRNFLLFLAAILAIYAKAQSPIIDMSWIPEAGDKWESEYIQITSFDPGSGGENQTWDFSTLDNSQALIFEMDILAPEDAPGYENFPEATFVWHFAAFEFFNFYFADQDSLALYGGVAASGPELETIDILTVYSDPQDGMKFPVSYGHESTYFGAFTTTIFGGFSTSGTRNGTVTADGYGTIITPQGTFENVLRVIIEDFTGFDTSTQYAWMQADNFVPIMVYEENSDGERTVYYSKKDDDGDNPTSTWETHQLDASLMIQSISSDLLRFSFQSEIDFNQIDFSLSNLSGQSLAGKTTAALANQQQYFQLNLPALPSGIYFLSASTSSGLITKKVFIP